LGLSVKNTKGQKALFVILWRGLRKKCPNCGRGRIFKGWFSLNNHCSFCGCEFQQREDDTYFFMYISTGVITGIFLISMFFVFPRDFLFGKSVLLVLSIGLFVLTHPYRKGVAIAIDYFVDRKSDFPKHDPGAKQ